MVGDSFVCLLLLVLGLASCCGVDRCSSIDERIIIYEI